MPLRHRLLLAASLALAVFPSNQAEAQRHIRDICHVKGQEENTLQGMGLVVGLKGTGDGAAKPTARALARMMELMGSPLPKSRQGSLSLGDLDDAKNVALVFVTATIPGAGARQGDRLDCQVSAISAKSLEGGILMMTALLGPQPADHRVYAFSQGPLQLSDPSRPGTATVHRGCRLAHDFFNVYHQETEAGKFVTLVLDRDHATWQTATEVASLINSQSDLGEGDSQDRNSDQGIAIARDQVNIVVRVSEQYNNDLVAFIALLMDTRILNPNRSDRVVINERAGIVVVGADVEIGPVAITHKNLAIEAGGGSSFVGFDPERSAEPKLKSLVAALNALQVPTSDVIQIIKRLERSGQIFGDVIIE